MIYTHVGFSGTRKGLTPKQRQSLRGVLARELASEGIGHDGCLRQGDCTGADREAFLMARAMGKRNIVHPPDIDTLRAFCSKEDEGNGEVEVLGPRGYIDRNHDIVNASSVLIACPDGYEEARWSGTWSTVRYARKKRVRLILIWPDGNVEEEKP